jgi:adenosine deaminase
MTENSKMKSAVGDQQRSETGNTNPILLISLGQSWAIVPEAFLLPGVEFRAVFIITTESTRVDQVQAWFNKNAPGVGLSITRVVDFTDLKNEGDHYLFEEVLHRWILDSNTRPEDRYFCLSGGFKTMSAAVQKAANFFGAREVFHVIAENSHPGPNGPLRRPETDDEIRDACENGRVHWIRLGPEAGWPQLRSCDAAQFPLETTRKDGAVRWVRSTDFRLRQLAQELLERSHRIARAWDGLHTLPFPDVATWSESELDWLRSPLDPQSPADRDWVSRLPKIELHCHLGGFATSGECLEEVRSAALNPERLPPVKPIQPIPGWPRPVNPVGLRSYQTLGDNNGTALLRDPGCLRRQCELLYERLLEQRVLYAEIRCSPANYSTPENGRSPWQVLEEIRATFQKCMEDAKAECASEPLKPPPCHVNLIVIGTRQSGGDYRSGIARHLALAVTAAEHWVKDDECRVVGVDLAGYEDVTTRGHYFREEFTAVHRRGLAVTVHAGENDDAEAIWRAVFDLNARRIGHALSLAESPELLRSVASRGIGVEMCPYANLQIKGFPLPPASRPGGFQQGDYPLKYYLDQRVRVTVNTDNIGISAATLTDNLLLAAELCPRLTRLDVLRMQRDAIETAFTSAPHRERLASRFAAAIPRP